MSDNETLEKLRQRIKEQEKARHEPCPSCGRCPTCGRGGVGTLPYVPTYPSMPWYPYPARPYWMIDLTPTWTTNTTSAIGPDPKRPVLSVQAVRDALSQHSA